MSIKIDKAYLPLVKCTKEHPWKDDLVPIEHQDTYEVGEQEVGWPGGDVIRIKCRNCGHQWKQELPQ